MRPQVLLVAFALLTVLAALPIAHGQVPSLQASIRPQMLLVAFAVLAVLAALPIAHGQGASPWPCCDKCGVCTKSIPPQCRCQDVSPTGCNSACKSCVRSTGGFQCADSITNFCERRCTPAA